MLCWLELSGEFIEAVWLTRNGDSSPFSPDLHSDECLPPLFITSTTYCKVAIVPSTMVHTASPIATLNELNVGSSLFPDVIHFHRYACMRFAKSGCAFEHRVMSYALSLAANNPWRSICQAKQMRSLCRTKDSASAPRQHEWPEGSIRGRFAFDVVALSGGKPYLTESQLAALFLHSGSRMLVAAKRTEELEGPGKLIFWNQV